MLTLISMLSLSSPVFCAVAGQVRRKNLTTPFRLITAQAWCAVAVEIASQLFQNYYPHKSNHIVYNVYMPFDFALLFCAGFWFLDRRLKLLNWLGLGVYFLVWGASLVIQGPTTMANFSIICGALILAVRYIQVLIWNSRQPSGAQTTGIYFIAVSILIYYCCMIPIFSLMHYFIRENAEMAARIFYLNFMLATLKYLGTGIGLLIVGRAYRSNTALHV